MSASIDAELLHHLVGQTAPDHADLWLIDLRSNPPAIFGVFARAWTRDGVCARDMTATLEDGPLALTDRILKSGASAVILALGPEPIGRHIGETGRHLMAVLCERLPREPRAIVCDAAGKPLADVAGSALAIAPAELTVVGMRRFQFPEMHLPARLAIKMPYTEDPDGCSIVIEGTCSCPLPAPSRFALPGPDRATLVVDCVPDFAGKDRWEVTVAGPTGVPHPARRLVPNPPPPLLSRLLVVFDRTCPDEDRWSAARDLMVKGAPETEDLMPAPESLRLVAADPASNPRDINVTLRHALGQVLAESLAPTVTIEAYWFADVPGDGLSAPPGVETSPVGFGRAGQALAGDAASLFAELTYYPGLDIWDALDDALAAALEDERPQQRTALLIVGNSPPHLPTRAESPLHRIRRRSGGATAFRRWANYWHENLHFCRARRMPAGYLFLTHRQCAPAEQRDFDVFRATQVELALALEECGLDLERTPATEAGLRRGAPLLLKRLEAADPRSRVEVISKVAL